MLFVQNYRGCLQRQRIVGVKAQELLQQCTHQNLDRLKVKTMKKLGLRTTQTWVRNEQVEQA